MLHTLRNYTRPYQPLAQIFEPDQHTVEIRGLRSSALDRATRRCRYCPRPAERHLLVSSRYDEATPLIVGQIQERIPGSKWVIFEKRRATCLTSRSPKHFWTAMQTFRLTVD